MAKIRKVIDGVTQHIAGDVLEIFGDKYTVHGGENWESFLWGHGVSNDTLFKKLDPDSDKHRIIKELLPDSAGIDSLRGTFPQVKGLRRLNKIIHAFQTMTV